MGVWLVMARGLSDSDSQWVRTVKAKSARVGERRGVGRDSLRQGLSVFFSRILKDRGMCRKVGKS